MTPQSPQEIQEHILEEFRRMGDDYESKLHHIMDLANTLAPLPTSYRTQAHAITGCMSQVWVVFTPGAPHMDFQADSDAQITRGILSLLQRILLHQPFSAAATAILLLEKDVAFSQLLGTQRSLGLVRIFDHLKLHAVRQLSSNSKLPSRAAIVQALQEVYDPELPVDIYALGLIYAIDIAANGDVRITMTLTSPNCPEAESIPLSVDKRIRKVDHVREVYVELTFDPPYDPSRMSAAAQLALGIL